MLKDVKLLIFDVDGTLLNSVKFNYKNINQTLESLGHDYYVSEEKVRMHLGCTAEDYYRGILGKALYRDWVHIREEARKNTQTMMHTYGEAFEGVQTTFKKLKEKGITLVLYSNCSRPYLDSAIDVTGVGPYIDYAECVKENGLEKAPLIHKILKLYPECKAAVVGDRIHDVEAAHENGLICIGARYGFGKEELQESDYMVDCIDELINLCRA